MKIGTSRFINRNRGTPEVSKQSKHEALILADQSINEFLFVTGFEKYRGANSEDLVGEIANRCILNSAIYAGLWLDDKDREKLDVQTRFVYAVHQGVLIRKNILDRLKDADRKFYELPNPTKTEQLFGEYKITITETETDKVHDILLANTADMFFGSKDNIVGTGLTYEDYRATQNDLLANWQSRFEQGDPVVDGLAENYFESGLNLADRFNNS